MEKCVDKEMVGKGKKRKHVVEDEEQSVKDKSGDFFRIVGRYLPFQLCKVIGKLRKNQVKAVEDMGFGKILKLNANQIPSKLGYFVVEKLNTRNMEIKCQRGSIIVDSDAIHMLLGLPNSGVDLVGLKKPTCWSSLGARWRGKYKSKLIKVKDIGRSILSNGDDGTMFQLDFLVLFFNTMVECQLNSKCKLGVLDYVEDDMEIGKMDLCGFIVLRIKECKKKWRSEDLNSHFQGALTILTLLYVDGCTCEGINEQ